MSSTNLPHSAGPDTAKGREEMIVREYIWMRVT